MEKLTFGVVVPQGWRGDLAHVKRPAAKFEAMVETAREAERLGFDSVWLYDHFQVREGQPPEATFECWTSLAAIARETTRVRLGQLVTCVGYRNPALLAKMTSTLDAASGGRVVLGLGAGWDEAEWRAYGYPEPFPSVGERLRRLEEAICVIRAMWGGGRASFAGEHYRVAEALNEPRSAQPRIPLLVGGAGERVLLRLVAQYADACNLTDSLDPDFYRGKLAVLRRHCDDVGRDYDEILRTASFTVAVPPGGEAELGETLAAIADAGIQSFVLYFEQPARLETMQRFAAEVRPRL